MKWRVENRFFIEEDEGKRVGFRSERDSKSERFHIIGDWFIVVRNGDAIVIGGDVPRDILLGEFSINDLENMGGNVILVVSDNNEGFLIGRVVKALFVIDMSDNSLTLTKCDPIVEYWRVPIRAEFIIRDKARTKIRDFDVYCPIFVNNELKDEFFRIVDMIQKEWGFI